MMHTLKRKTKNKKHRTVGRGGRHAKTSGRGTKGQNSRAGRKLRPQLRDIIKKLPKLRGRGKNVNKAYAIKPATIYLSDLNVFKAGEVVTPKTLFEKGIIELRKGRVPEVKILSTGSVDKAVTVSECLVSAVAKTAIEKAGGSVTSRTLKIVK
jgi:large subunit ribosomal protein L15